MKKFLLSFTIILLIGFSLKLNGQASCPQFSNIVVNTVSGCNRTVSFNYYNPTSGAKSFSLTITCGGTPVYTSPCIDASGDQDVVKSFTTAQFACCDLSSIVVTFTSRTNGTCGGGLCGIFIEEEPIPLPVHFKSFNANRSTLSSVAINWTTATEHNNKGFNIQKNVSGEWKTIAFVPSKAREGNSSSDLSYSYTDVNSEKGITQYRVQQVDLDGKFAFTDIRAIRGDNTLGKIVVYPNPSVDGKLNVVFEDNAALRDVYVNDMQGKIIRSYKNISNNILVIDRLTSGFYTVKITNRNTAASTVEKVVVK